MVQNGPILYSLYGVVEHSGTLHGGHYVAYVKVCRSCHSKLPTGIDVFVSKFYSLIVCFSDTPSWNAMDSCGMSR